MKLTIGDKVLMNLPGHAMHGQSFEIVKVNARHRFRVLVAAPPLHLSCRVD